jgi:ribosomal protein S18 acetylase RimI-like enzyme
LGESRETRLPPDVLDDARAAGWPDDVLERAVEVGMPLNALRRFAGWGLDAEGMRRKLDWHERLTRGPLRGREANLDDNEAYCELWAHAPESIGEFDVTTERGPRAFAQYRLQERAHVLVIADGATLVASCGFATRNVFVNGKRLCVHYGQGLRVHRDWRRRGFGDQVRSLAWGIDARGTACQYDIMRTTNFAVVGWWEKYFPEFWKDVPQEEGQVPGIPVVVHRVPARAGSAAAAAIRPARLGDLARCASLVNRTHRGTDLFRPYSRERLRDRLDEAIWGEPPPWWRSVYGWRDFFVVEDAGRVVACGGLWDRGADLRERWRHRETGEERTISDACLMDFGFEEGAEDAMRELIAFFAGRTGELGRDHLLAPVQQLPSLAEALEADGAAPDRRALRWGHPSVPLTRPYTDLAYW